MFDHRSSLFQVETHKPAIRAFQDGKRYIRSTYLSADKVHMYRYTLTYWPWYYNP